MSVRTDVAALLKTDWAEIPELASVYVVATERALDDIQVTTALLRGKSMGRAPSSPNSHRHVGLLLTLISPLQDLDAAGDELDDLTSAALDYLDSRFMHDDATTVSYGDRLAVDIPLTILASKE